MRCCDVSFGLFGLLVTCCTTLVGCLFLVVLFTIVCLDFLGESVATCDVACLSGCLCGLGRWWFMLGVGVCL